MVDTLTRRIKDLQCEKCGRLTDTPLTTEEEETMDTLLNEIKALFETTPLEKRQHIKKLARKIRTYRGSMFIDASTAEAFVEELCGQV